MSATETYRPTKLKDIIGNQKAIKELVDLFLAHKRDGSIPKILIYGPPGIGKTTAVRALALHLKSYKFKLKETNASDSRRKNELLDIIRHARSKPFVGRYLIFLDEIDGIKNWALIRNLMKKTNNPLIFVANDIYKVPTDIKKICNVIQFYMPWLNEVVERLHKIQKKERKEMDFSSTTRDVRQSINALMYGGENYKPSSNPFTVVEDVCVHHDLSSYEYDEHFIWLLDNVKHLYTGKDLLDALEILSIHEETRFNDVLTLLPTSRRLEEWNKIPATSRYPFYKRRLMVLWSKPKK